MWIKGAQKQMIVVRTASSRYFDEAYFVLRREMGGRSVAQNEMLTEAYRILEEYQLKPRAKKTMPRSLLLFFGGLLLGGVAAVLLCLLLL